MMIRPLEDVEQSPPDYGEDESDETRVDFDDSGNEQDNSEGESDKESDFNESLYGDESSEDDKLFNEYVDSESEWFRKEFESHGGGPCESGDILSVKEIIVHSDDDLTSNNGSDDDSFPVFNPVELYDPTFKIGMLFSTKEELRHAVHSHGVKTKRSINITKNDKVRLHAKCANTECGWKLHALKLYDECTFQIRAYESEHTCAPSAHVKNLKSGWLSMKYASKFRSDPKRNVKGFRVDVIEEIRCHVSKYQVYKAKKKAILLVEGMANDQYSLLWDFAEKIKRTNPGSTVIIGTDGSNADNRFDRFYLCLQALKVCFRAGCRPFIGVDGCHLKGPCGGVLLSAVGVDPNNNNFPIAFAIVNSESRDTWEWFLTLLKMDLNIENDYEWTFMSDKQKGLIQAFNEVFPNADHRFCVRHLHSNFKNAGFRGQAFKSALWNCAMATTVNDFGRRMKEMRDLDKRAADWFNDKPPNQWSRSHFTDISNCDMLLNNGCESFNSSILDARDKPIISMCEWIIEYLMKRMQVNRDRAELRWTGSLCPKIQKLIDKNYVCIGDCIPIKSDNFHYQISCFDGSKYSVDLEKGTCVCRKWDLSGIPCKHALSAIYTQGLDYYKFTHKCYGVDYYKMAYAPAVMPINGRNEWNPTNLIPPLPPNFGRPAGRPKKARRREKDEVEEMRTKRQRGKELKLNENRMRRQQKTLRCSNCGVHGHNKKTCTSNIASPSPIVNEEMVASQEEPISQLTQELECQRPQKIQVRRKVSLQEVIGDGLKITPNTGTKNKVVVTPLSGNNEVHVGPLARLVTVPPPSMYQQFQKCQIPAHVNNRAPTPFVGGCFIPSIEKCISQSCTTSKSIITEGGKKFLSFSSLSSTISEVKHATEKSKDKEKGKRTDE